MTNKMIDVGVFWVWFKKFVRDNTQVFHGDEKGDHHAVDEEDLLYFTEQKINELVNLEPAPQESMITVLKKAMVKDITGKSLTHIMKLSDELKGGKGGTFENGYITAINTWLEYINNLQTQESIFDANGWCTDFELSKKYEKILVCTETDIIIARPESLTWSCLKWQPLPKI